MFPLELMLLPGEQTSLHIFEMRYRNLLKAVENENGLFGIPYFTKDGSHELGSLVRLIDVVKRYPGGESDIIVEGIQVFKLLNLHEGNGEEYPVGEAQVLDEYVTWLAGDEVNKELEALREIIGPKADILKKEEYRYMMRIVNSLGLTHEQKHSFLKINNMSAQEKHVARLLKLSRLIIVQEKQIEGGIFPN